MRGTEILGNATGLPLLEGDERAFRDRFNRASFALRHHLSDHPLFELPRLLELAKSMPEGGLYYDAGDVRVDQRWDQTPPCTMSVEELIQRIEHAGAWIIIRHAQKDPEYGALLDRCLSEAQDLIGVNLDEQVTSRIAIVFISSPNRVTTYHIDRECNFLLQIHGEKTIHLFDRYDRTVLPEEELERFWTVDNNAAVYKEQYQDRAQIYNLQPGSGVHIPVNAPHWLMNGDNISVTLAITFQFHDSALASIYRTNYYLRKLGITPTPPGRSKLRDALKSSTMGCALGLRRAFRRIHAKT